MAHIQEERASKAEDGSRSHCWKVESRWLEMEERRGDGGLRGPARWEIRDDDAGKPGAPLCFRTAAAPPTGEDMHNAKGPQ